MYAPKVEDTAIRNRLKKDLPLLSEYSSGVLALYSE